MDAYSNLVARYFTKKGVNLLELFKKNRHCPPHKSELLMTGSVRKSCCLRLKGWQQPRQQHIDGLIVAKKGDNLVVDVKKKQGHFSVNCYLSGLKTPTVGVNYINYFLHFVLSSFLYSLQD